MAKTKQIQKVLRIASVTLLTFLLGFLSGCSYYKVATSRQCYTWPDYTCDRTVKKDRLPDV